MSVPLSGYERPCCCKINRVYLRTNAFGIMVACLSCGTLRLSGDALESIRVQSTEGFMSELEPDER